MINKTAEQQILDKVEETSRMVHDIHVAIAGNEQLGQIGIKHTLKDHGEKIDKLTLRMDEKDKKEFKRNVVIAAISGGSGAGAGILSKGWLLKGLGAFLAFFK